MESVEGLYLKDLGLLLRRTAENIRPSPSSGPEEQAFEQGRQMAYFEVLSLMKQQANAFGMEQQRISLDGFEPESLFHR